MFFKKRKLACTLKVLNNLNNLKISQLLLTSTKLRTSTNAFATKYKDIKQSCFVARNNLYFAIAKLSDHSETHFIKQSYAHRHRHRRC